MGGVENDFVWLLEKRHRGWPWPDESLGLGPMFGDEGWCHECGVPLREQTGSMVLRRDGMRVEGAWHSNWRYDVLCLEAGFARELGQRFRLEFRPVEFRGKPAGEAVQVVMPVTASSWFPPEELRAAAVRRHGRDGKLCPSCGTWKWLPLPIELLPAVDPGDLGGFDIVMGPDWFGDVRKAFRLFLTRRALAEEIIAASPRDFTYLDVDWAANGSSQSRV